MGRGQADHPVTGESTTGPVLAVVNLTEILSPSDPPGPKVLSVLPLFGGSFTLTSDPTDVILKDHLAVVSGDRNGVLVDLSDLSQPQITGQIEGIGGRLASGDGSLIFSSAFSVAGGQSDLGGIRSAATGRIAVVTGHEPDPILVSQGDEVFRNVSLGYKVVPPDPEITSGSVDISVRSGSSVASVPAAVSPAGSGSATWPQGAIVDVSKTYDARLRVLKDSQPVPSAPKRLRFEKVPLAITTSDRMLRIQFALPEQGIFREQHYHVNVYLAAPGGAFPASPNFFVPSQEIEFAEPNRERWWGRASAEGSFVTTRIEEADVVPPGSDTSIDRRAFEIGTILASYPKVKVQVVSDETGRVLAEKEGQVTADLEWSAVLEKVTDRLRASAGESVPPEPVLPPPGSVDLTRIFTRSAGLTFRVVHFLEQWRLACGAEFVRGLLDGFKEGIDGDVATVQMVGTLFTQNPVTTAKAIYEVLKEVFRLYTTRDQLFAMVRDSFLDGVSDPLNSTIFLTLEGSYYLGCLVGFVIEQALVIALATWVTTEVLGLGGVVVAKLKTAGWITRGTRVAVVLLRSVRYFIEGLTVSQGARVTMRAILGFVRESRVAFTAFWDKYPRGAAVVRRIADVSRTSQAVARRSLYWLGIVDSMAEAAAHRLILFFERQGPELADAWLTRWTSLANGNRAVKAGFEASNLTGGGSIGLHHALVVAGNLDETVPFAYVNKYTAAGNRVESSLRGLRTSLDDVRFPDDAIADAVVFHSRVDVLTMSDEAVEGTARVMRIPCTRVAAVGILAAVIVPLGGCGRLIPDLVREQYAALLPRLDTALANLKHANDLSADEAFARLLWAGHNVDAETAQAVIRAASFRSATPQAVAEYMKAVDSMREPGSNSIMTGLLDAAPTPGSTINVRRVGNDGAGSLAEGFEPVAMRRLIEGGSPSLPRPYSRADIRSFGRKHNVGPITGGSPSTIEADVDLFDGTLIDMKHSLTADPRVTPGQIDVLTMVLAEADQTLRPINRAIFVTNAPVGQSVLDRVRQANEVIKASRGISEDLIHVVEDIGGFPLP